MKHQRMQGIGLERIYRLFELAELEFPSHPRRSKRYVEIAMGVSKKMRTKMPDEFKEKFCKKCGSFLSAGKNSRAERKGSLTIVKCLECGSETKRGRKAKAGEQ